MRFGNIPFFVAALIAMLASLAGAPNAFAGPLTGDSISVYFAEADTSTPYTAGCGDIPAGCFSEQSFTVGSGAETTYYVADGPVANIDFSDDRLVITWIDNVTDGSTGFHGFVFTDATNNFDPIGSVSGLSASLVSEDADQLYVSLDPEHFGIFDKGDTITINFGATPAPEPSTWAMMLLGFAGIGYAGYRRSRSTVPVV